MMLLRLITVVISVNIVLAVSHEECGKKPKEKHCIIEYASRERFPHSIRHVYDWYTNKCFVIRWSEHCPPPPPYTNNFGSLEQCESDCLGWA